VLSGSRWISTAPQRKPLDMEAWAVSPGSGSTPSLLLQSCNIDSFGSLQYA
jgi:hypothetical protein